MRLLLLKNIYINYNMPEVIEISQDNDFINIENVSEPPSVNSGGGLELLMNDRKKEKSSSDVNIDITDINTLEKELNDLTDETANIQKETQEEEKSFFSGWNNPKKNEETINEVKEELFTQKDPIFNMKDNVEVPIEPKKTQEEKLSEKFRILHKLENLEKKGVRLTKKYSMESPLNEMKGEYEMIMSEKEKSNSVKFQGKMLMAAVTGIEFLNNKFDPFDINLDGWSEQLNENVDDYDEIFGELHEKYSSKATMAPELKLLFQLAGSGIMVHMTNSIFKSSIPGVEDIMKQNPELMKQFSQAAVNSVGNDNPGLGNFMNDMMRPPEPVDTKVTRNRDPPMNPSRSQGIEINDTQEYVEKSRPEMKGPSNLDDILSGLKSKQRKQVNETEGGGGSTISIHDLKEMENVEMPTKVNRRKKSDKNIVSLEL